MEKAEEMQLKKLSANIRLHVLKELKWRTYGHLGGALSIVEVLSVLYGKYMHHDPIHPDWDERDYLVLSKGHAGPGLYCALAVVGYFDEEILYTLNEGGTSLPSHPDRLKTLGVDMTTGSLGQGTSVAAGLGYALRLQRKDNKVYLIVGDGELNEGQCWEAFQFIAHNKLNNIIVFIDDNKKQLDGYTKDIINSFRIEEKMEAFGFHTKRVKGDDEAAIAKALDEAFMIEDKAICIILDTIKGQGVPYFETMEDNHSVKFKEKDNTITDMAIQELQTFVEGGDNSCGS